MPYASICCRKYILGTAWNYLQQVLDMVVFDGNLVTRDDTKKTSIFLLKASQKRCVYQPQTRFFVRRFEHHPPCAPPPEPRPCKKAVGLKKVNRSRKRPGARHTPLGHRIDSLVLSSCSPQLIGAQPFACSYDSNQRLTFGLTTCLLSGVLLYTYLYQILL